VNRRSTPVCRALAAGGAVLAVVACTASPPAPAATNPQVPGVTAGTPSTSPTASAASTASGTVSPTPSASVGALMPEARFWSIIAATKPGPSLSAQEQIKRLQAQLVALSTEDILAFDRRFLDLHRSLATPRHRGAAWIIVGWYRDDEFFNMRSMAISRGRAVYERFLADPDSFVDLGLRTDDQLKSYWAFAELVPKLYADRTGQDLPADHPTVVIPVLGPPIDDATYERLAAAYPRLAKAYLPPAVRATGTPSGGGTRSVTWLG
jgi:hypothetical protein